jgi:hypothetical protein
MILGVVSAVALSASGAAAYAPACDPEGPPPQGLSGTAELAGPEPCEGGCMGWKVHRSG